MSRRSGRESDTYESELKDLEYKYYQRLKYEEVKVRFSDSGYECPYCSEVVDYSFKELIRHADHVGGASRRRRSLREIAQHLALSFYVGKYLRPEDSLSSAARPSKGAVADVPTEVKDGRGVTNISSKPKDELTNELPRSKHGSDSATKPDPRPPLKDDERKFVWPCIGIVANIPTEHKGGKRVGESGSNLRDELTTKGFDPVRVTPLWNHMGHSGFAIVEFQKDWIGYKNAVMFENNYELRKLGRADYYSRYRRRDEMYGWLAREDDYNSNNIVGINLKKKGDLRSISDVTSEYERKDASLFSFLQNTLDDKKEREKEMQEKYRDSEQSVEEVLKQKEEMDALYNQEIQKMQQSVRDDFKRILLERERAKLNVEAQRMKLEQQEKQLQERERHNEYELSNLKQKKEMNEKAILEQKKAEADMLKLAQEHQRAKEEMHKKIFELETQLDATQAVELEIEQLRGSLQVLEHYKENDLETQKQIEEIKEKLQDKEEDLEGLEDLNQTLIIKHKKVEQEIDEGRKELIKGNARIGAKRRGEEKPAVKRKRLVKGNEDETELWHFKEKREATLLEGISYIVQTWKRLKH
ncbi:Protein INVOLVED IN DE NOVO 2 [Linum perenne]